MWNVTDCPNVLVDENLDHRTVETAFITFRLAAADVAGAYEASPAYAACSAWVPTDSFGNRMVARPPESVPLAIALPASVTRTVPVGVTPAPPLTVTVAYVACP
jgi:hypothetical protein